MYVVAEFVDGVAISSSAPIGAFGEFLWYRGYLASAWDLATTNLDWDELGGMGNGIRDITETMLLQAIADDGSFDRTPYGGTGNRTVYEAFAHNVAQAEADLPSAPEYGQRAVAAYMTLGTAGHVEFIVGAAMELWEATLDPADYIGSRGLAPLDDADGDGVWNRLEWMQIVEEYQIVQPDLDDALTYVQWAMNPALPAREDIDIGLDLPDGDGTDWDYSHLPQATVTFNSGQDLPFQVRILDPPGREDVPVPIGQPVDIPLGAELLITLAQGANPDWFYTWSAPGNMIDGSAEKTERFRLMSGQPISPVRRPTDAYTLPETYGNYTWQWSGAGPYGHMIGPGTSSGGDTIIAPAGAYVNLSAYTSEEAPGEPGTSTAGANTRRAKGFNYKFKDVACTTYSGTPTFYLKHVTDIQPFFTAVAPHGYLTHIAISGEGGDAFIDAIANAINLVGYDGGLYETVRTLKPGSDDNKEYPLRVSCKPEPGYQVVAWNGAFAGPAYLGTSAGIYTKNSGSKGGSVASIKKQTLELEVKVEGGNGTPAEAGHLGAGPAKKYYPNYGTEHVNLTAHPHIGYYFTGWSGDGIAYLEDERGDPDFENPVPLDNPQNPITDTSIWIAMGEEEDGGGAKAAGVEESSGREIEAEFNPEAAIVINGGGTIGSTSASGPLQNLGFDVTTGQQPMKTGPDGLLEAIKTHHVFVFYGHHGPDDYLRIAYDKGITYEGVLSPADVQSTKPHPGYRLVLILGCSMSDAEATAWKDAFDAECLIGFSGQVNELWVDNFEEKFWEEVENGAWAAAAAGTAWVYAEPVGEVSLIVKGNVKLKKD